MPIRAMTLNSVRPQQQGNEGPHASGGQGGEDCDRVDVALVEHPEHDVDGHEGRKNQQGLIAQRILKRLGRALKTALNTRGHSQLLRGRFDRRHRISQGNFRREVERNGRCGKLSLVTDGERPRGLRDAGDGTQRDLPASGAPKVDRIQFSGVCLKSGFTSRTTRYWFNCVKMVETCRWP